MFNKIITDKDKIQSFQNTINSNLNDAFNLIDKTHNKYNRLFKMSYFLEKITSLNIFKKVSSFARREQLSGFANNNLVMNNVCNLINNTEQQDILFLETAWNNVMLKNIYDGIIRSINNNDILGMNSALSTINLVKDGIKEFGNGTEDYIIFVHIERIAKNIIELLENKNTKTTKQEIDNKIKELEYWVSRE